MENSNNDIDKLWEEFKEECEEIARQCEEEGYPSHGSNYELRVDSLKESYPELFSQNDEDHDIDTDFLEKTHPELFEKREYDPDEREAEDIGEDIDTFNDTKKYLDDVLDRRSLKEREEELER